MPRAQGYRRFPCPDLWKNGVACPKSFKNMGDLTRHRLIHSGIKAHVCGECGKAFTQRSQLKTHHTSRHTTDRPYKCDICSDTFPDPSSRTRHCREQHEGGFICPIKICGRRIGRKGKFKKHLVEHRIQFSEDDVDHCFVRRTASRRERVAAAKMREPKAESPDSSTGLLPLSSDPGPSSQQIALPQLLYPIDPSFSPSQSPDSHCPPLPSHTPAHDHVALIDLDLWNQLHEDLPTHDYYHSSASLSPPSLSSSLSSSPESGCSPLHDSPYPPHPTMSDADYHQQSSLDQSYPSALSPGYLLPYEPCNVHMNGYSAGAWLPPRASALSPLPWLGPQIDSHLTFSPSQDCLFLPAEQTSYDNTFGV